MLDLARDIIGTQPILALFLAIGLGYLVGQINIGGFSLGVGAVLFVGLAIGAFAPKAQITGPIGLTGLIMFLYGIGILYGRQFFEGMTGAAGRKYNLLALVAVRRRARWSPSGLGKAFGIKIGHTLGIFAGSMTSTATLQAALDVMGNSDPSIGYSVAYPVRRDRSDPLHLFHDARGAAEISAQGAALPYGRDHARRQLRSDARSRTLEQRSAGRRAGHDGPQGRSEHRAGGRPRACVRRRPPGRRRSPGGNRRGRANGWARLEPGRIVKDRSALDYIRVFVAQGRTWSACRWRSCRCRPGFPAHLLHVRRYDVDLVPTPDLMLEFGDRVGVLDAARPQGGGPASISATP